MRSRQRRELASESPDRWNLKVGEGGITDLEFIAAVLQLTAPEGTPDLGSEPLEVFRAAARHIGPLGVDPAELSEAYGFLRRVEGRLRLRTATHAGVIDWGSREGGRLASSLGFADAAALRGELRRRRAFTARAARAILG
jgi:glutamine synthetase adenylyltransferase